MHTETGRIVDWGDIENLPQSERAKYVPVVRDLTAREQLNKQIRLYAPYGCGSDKKFKFCCHRKLPVQIKGKDDSNTSCIAINHE